MSAKVPVTPSSVPSIDEKANRSFLDTLFDTDGKPDSEAEAVPEIEGLDDDDDAEANR